jgi:hypothetical protein
MTRPLHVDLDNADALITAAAILVGDNNHAVLGLLMTAAAQLILDANDRPGRRRRPRAPGRAAARRDGRDAGQGAPRREPGGGECVSKHTPAAVRWAGARAERDPARILAPWEGKFP